MPSLTGAGLVTGVSGKGGGYSLAKPVAEYTVGEILRVSEELLAPVVCLGEDFVCDKADGCKALPVWMKLDSIISDYPHLC